MNLNPNQELELHVHSQQPLDLAQDNKIELEINGKPYILQKNDENQGNQGVALKFL